MRRWLSLSALVALALFAAPARSGAQIVDVNRYYNPFTGRRVTRVERYNPFTGRHSEVRRMYNPLTGRATVNWSSHNHYTGASSHFGAAYNPLAGRYGWRGYYRRW
jgi:hypothetical protein